MGRPSRYTPEIAETICRRLAEGESLRAICRDEGMPSAGAVLGWRDDVPGFAEQYARARTDQAHVIAEAALDEALAAPDPALGRLAFDARRWFAGKLLPKVYGDKVQHTGDGGGAISVQVTIDDARSEPPSEATS